MIDSKEKVSVLIRARNEYPIILGTINSILEDLEYAKLNYEFIIVSNGSTDHLPEVMEDRYRRWIRTKILKVIRYAGEPSTWQAINAGWLAATGDVLVVADAHISVKVGSIQAIVRGARELGGIHHGSVQRWGDTDQIRGYGYDMTLENNFWGGACRIIPPGVDPSKPWQIPMAGACLYSVHRSEISRFGLYHQALKAYGGGEPYLDLKWWLLGSKVWMQPEALCRHAFGINHHWVKATKDKKLRLEVYKKDGTISRFLKKDDEYLGYRAGYTVPNDEFYFNFLLASYLIGGEVWLNRLKNSFSAKCKNVETIGNSAIEAGKEHREWIKKNATCTLDELLANPPWKSCGVHGKAKEVETQTQFALKSPQEEIDHGESEEEVSSDEASLPIEEEGGDAASR